MDIRADLHIHTVLSPCGDLEMSPENILYFAQVQGLNMIGSLITTPPARHR